MRRLRDVSYGELIAWHAERVALAEDKRDRSFNQTAIERFEAAAQWHRDVIVFLEWERDRRDAQVAARARRY